MPYTSKKWIEALILLSGGVSLGIARLTGWRGVTLLVPAALGIGLAVAVLHIYRPKVATT